MKSVLLSAAMFMSTAAFSTTYTCYDFATPDFKDENAGKANLFTLDYGTTPEEVVIFTLQDHAGSARAGFIYESADSAAPGVDMAVRSQTTLHSARVSDNDQIHHLANYELDAEGELSSGWIVGCTTGELGKEQIRPDVAAFVAKQNALAAIK